MYKKEKTYYCADFPGENGSEFKAENILVDLATRNTFASAASTSSRPLPPSGDAALCAAMCRAR